MATIKFCSRNLNQEIEITTVEHLGTITPKCVVNGKRFFGCLQSPEKQSANLKAQLTKIGKSGSWTMGTVDAMMVLDAEIGQQVADAIAAEQAAFDLTPARAMELLIKQRRHIVEDINDNRSIAESRRDRGFESGEGSGRYVTAGKKFDDAADEASKKLAEFDQAHPEIIAEIRRRRDAETEKNRWN